MALSDPPSTRLFGNYDLPTKPERPLVPSACKVIGSKGIAVLRGCPKCGDHENLSVKYRGEMDMLYVDCGVCKYKWMEPPVDSLDPMAEGVGK